MKRMRKVIIFLFIALANICCCYSQSVNNNIKLYSIPSPNAASLGSFGIVPVSPFSGKADVSIPIYSTTVRDVLLNISLMYDTSGNLVNMLPGWTGHGWTLSAGGAITRKVNYMPDEMSFAGTKAGYDKRWDYYIDEYKKEEPVFCPTSDVNNTVEYEMERQDYLEDLGDWEDKLDDLKKKYGKQKDTYQNFKNYFSVANTIKIENGDTDEGDYDVRSCDEYADEFYFNFMGKTGCFYYGNDGNWKVRSDENLVVEFDVKNQNNYISVSESRERGFVEQAGMKVIKGFTMIDAKGIRYKFGGDETSIELSAQLLDVSDNNYSSFWHAVTWMLKSVEDRFGNVLYSFSYSKGIKIAQMQRYCDFQFTKHGKKDQYQMAVPATLIAPVYLDKITTLDGINVEFEHSRLFSKGEARDFLYPTITDVYIEDSLLCTRKAPITEDKSYQKDVDFYVRERLGEMNLEKLDNIRIGTNEKGNLSVYHLGYVKEPRLHLTSVEQIADNRIVGSFTLDYDHYHQFPKDYCAEECDYWGYYNSFEYSPIDLVPMLDEEEPQMVYARTRLFTDSVSRCPRYFYYGTASTCGMLNKITYPTGGYTVFEYSNNWVGKYASLDRQSMIETEKDMLVGGVRIDRVSNFDENGKLLGRTDYSYCFPNSSLSSGELSFMPIIESDWDYKDDFSVVIKSTIVPMTTCFCPTIGYSYVTETHLDGSKVIHTYSNVSDEKDIANNIEQYKKSPVFYVYNDRSYMRGRKLSDTIVAPNGDVVCTKKYEYTSDKEYNEAHYVVSRNIVNVNCNTKKFDDSYKYRYSNLYKIFYFKPKLEKVIEKTKYGNTWVTDITTYDNENRSIAISNNDGFAYEANISNILSKTVERGNHVLKETYSYPYLVEDNATKLTRQFYLPIISTKRYLNGALIDGSKTVYGLCNNTIVPKERIEHKGNDGAMKTVVEYKSFTNDFMPKEMINKNGVNYKYFWNDKDQLVASVANGSQNISVNPSSKSARDILSSTDKQEVFGSMPTKIEACTYNARNLVASTINGNGYLTKYKYDAIGRLTETADKDGRQHTNYSYNYATSDGNIDGKLSDYCSLDYLSCTIDGQLLVAYTLIPNSVSPRLEIVRTRDNRIVDQIQLPADKLKVYNSYDISHLLKGEKYEARLVEYGQTQDSHNFTYLPSEDRSYLDFYDNRQEKKLVIYYHVKDYRSAVLRFYTHFEGDYTKNICVSRNLKSGSNGFLEFDYSGWTKGTYAIRLLVGGVTGQNAEAGGGLYVE